MKRIQAFTLIEILVVVAITTIMMGLLLGPIIMGFKYTAQAQTAIEAQNTARLVLETISRELSNAVFVFDNSTPDSPVNIYVKNRNGDIVPVPLQYAKIDFVPPGQGDTGNRLDPTTQKEMGSLNLPLRPGVVFIRYFIGLQKNYDAKTSRSITSYVNTYDDPRGLQTQSDNMYVLYRAEVRTASLDPNTNTMKPNTDLFDLDANGQPIMNDPNFFYGAHAAAWRAASHVVVELSNTDLIQVLREKRGDRGIIYEADTDGNPQNDLPKVIPLVSFTPQTISNEPALAARAQSQGIEVVDVTPSFAPALDPANSQFLSADESTGVAPTQYNSQHPGWTLTSSVTMYRTPPTVAQPDYYRYSLDYNTGHMTIRHFGTNQPPEGTPQFDVTAYMASLRAGTPTFNGALLAAASDSDVTPYYVDTKAGVVITAFPHDVLMPANAAQPFTFDVGPPTIPVLSGIPNNNLNTINGAFNDAVFMFTDQQMQLVLDVRRSIRLWKIPNSPLDRFTGATIVPGSEVVVGPDQNPGANYGLPVRYVRIPTNSDGVPGRNQYKINYVPKQSPNLERLDQFASDFVSELQARGVNRSAADLTDYIHNQYVARFEVGYVEFASEPRIPMPNTVAGDATVNVSYLFQVNRPNDSVVADYSTKQLIMVMVGVRRYDSTGAEAQQVMFTSKVKVRNFLGG